MISNPKLSIICKTVLLYSAVLGVLLQGGILRGGFDTATLRTFSTLGSILTAVYYLIALPVGGKGSVWCPPLKFAVLMSALLTGFAAHFLLRGAWNDASDVRRLALILLHDVVPVGMLLDWLLIDPRGTMRVTDPLLGVLPAALYAAAALIGVYLGRRVLYVYPFMDPARLGWPMVLLTVLGLAGAIIAAGYLLYGADRLLRGRGRK